MRKIVDKRSLAGNPNPHLTWQSPRSARERIRKKYAEIHETEDPEYTVIDFETMNQDKKSACAIGMQKIEMGVATRRYYKLIKPAEDIADKKDMFRYLHGISYRDLVDAKTFGELYDEIMDFIDGSKIICHNKVFDIEVFRSLCQYYNKDENEWGVLLDNRNVIDTYELTGCALDMSADAFCISMNKHHNALSDVQACADIFLELMDDSFPWSDAEIKDERGWYKSKKAEKAEEDKLHYSSLRSEENKIEKSKEYKDLQKYTEFLPEEEAEGKGNIFWQKEIGIIGEFTQFKKEELCRIIHGLGGKINLIPGLSTDMVVYGDNAKHTALYEEISNRKQRLIPELGCMAEVYKTGVVSFDLAGEQKAIDMLYDFIYKWIMATDKNWFSQYKDCIDVIDTLIEFSNKLHDFVFVTDKHITSNIVTPPPIPTASTHNVVEQKPVEYNIPVPKIPNEKNAVPPLYYASANNKKSKGIAIVLALFLGCLGIHQFYLNKKTAGILYLCFCWTYIPFVLSIIDILRYASMDKHTFEQKYNS